MRLVVLPVLAPALREGFFLAVWREPCDEVGMPGCDALVLEGFSHFGDELEQSEAGIDEAIALARSRQGWRHHSQEDQYCLNPWNSCRTHPDNRVVEASFRIVHPFHPLAGKS